MSLSLKEIFLQQILADAMDEQFNVLMTYPEFFGPYHICFWIPTRMHEDMNQQERQNEKFILEFENILTDIAKKWEDENN